MAEVKVCLLGLLHISFWLWLWFWISIANYRKAFPSYLLPLVQNESWCVNVSFWLVKVTFIWKALHQGLVLKQRTRFEIKGPGTNILEGRTRGPMCRLWLTHNYGKNSWHMTEASDASHNTQSCLFKQKVPRVCNKRTSIVYKQWQAMCGLIQGQGFLNTSHVLIQLSAAKSTRHYMGSFRIYSVESKAELLINSWILFLQHNIRIYRNGWLIAKFKFSFQIFIPVESVNQYKVT